MEESVLQNHYQRYGLEGFGQCFNQREKQYLHHSEKTNKYRIHAICCKKLITNIVPNCLTVVIMVV